MAFNSYSKALYELSTELNIAGEIERQSKSILKALETIKEFNAFIKNPLFKQAEQTEMLNTFVKKFDLNPTLGKFLKFYLNKKVCACSPKNLRIYLVLG